MDVDFLKYRYEDGFDGVITKKRIKLGIRHVQLVYMVVCSAVFGALRAANGVAVLAMSGPATRNDTYLQMHNWDSKIQGTVMSSFFFGYALMLLPAEFFFKKICGKIVISSALIVNGALSVALPTIVNKGGWIAMCNAQFLMGMTQACLCPANQSLLTRWLPPSERAIFSGFVYGGIQLGIIVALPVSGLLSESHLGWELVMYAESMLTLSMAVIWTLLTSGSPYSHQATGDEEKEYIKESLNCYHKKRLRKPWREMLASSEFWAIAAAHAASNAIYVLFLVGIPVYLQSFGASLKDSVSFTAVPFAAMWLLYLSTSPSIDWLHKTDCLTYVFNYNYFRKFINGLGAFAIVGGLSVLSYLAPDSGQLAIITAAATLALLGFQFSGFLENHRDMSENFAGSLLTLTSAIASVAGALVPLVTGLLLNDNIVDPTRWRPVFLVLMIFYVFCNVVYCILGSSQRQQWDGPGERTKFGYHNATNILELEDLGEIDQL